MRISDACELGERIVVQGGTFKNPAVLRAIEKLLGVKVICPDIAEHMGAYGAAITARQNKKNKDNSAGKEDSLFYGINSISDTIEKQIVCNGCTNNCLVRVLQFSNGRKYYTGNRCERRFSNSNKAVKPGDNLFKVKHELLKSFSPLSCDADAVTIGIPIVLNFFENYPFGATFFNEMGFKILCSSFRNNELQNSATTIMSDNICYPAKLVHAHIFDLISRKVDRIFFPRVVFEAAQFQHAANNFNCPVVTGYPDVVNSAINPRKYGVVLDSPTINFNDKKLLKKACRQYVSDFNVSEEKFQHSYLKSTTGNGSF